MTIPAWSVLPEQIGGAAVFLVLGSLSAMLFSMAKAGFGGSAGMLAVPVMIYACGGNVRLAAGILLPMLIAADYVAVVGWWRRWDARCVALMLPGTLAGVAAGWAVIHALGRSAGTGGAKDAANAGLRLGVGLIAVGFVVLHVVRSFRRRATAFRPGWRQGTAAGAAAGLTSTLSHAAGPIVTMYLLPQQMPKGRYVASTALYFWLANQIKLVPYFAEGLISARSLGAGAVLLPAVALGAVLGICLHRRVPQKHFTNVVYALLALAGADLIRKGIEGL